MGQKPTIRWLCPLKVLKHMLRNPLLKGNFAYYPRFRHDFSTIEFEHSLFFHVAHAECGETVIVVYINIDGTSTTSQMESELLYMRIANTYSPACFDKSAIQLISVLPKISSEDEVYGSAEKRLYAHADFRRIPDTRWSRKCVSGHGTRDRPDFDSSGSDTAGLTESDHSLTSPLLGW